jgi:hypothetical protein
MLHRSTVHIRYKTCHKQPLYNNKRIAESRQNNYNTQVESKIDSSSIKLIINNRNV